MAEQISQNDRHSKQVLNILNLLAEEPSNGCSVQGKNGAVTIASRRRKMVLKPTLLVAIKKKGLVHTRSKRVFLSFEGRRAIEHSSKPRGLGPVKQVINKATTRFNSNQSPILRLFRRKDKTGKTYLEVSEHLASEQLRRDFEMAGLQPRVTAQYEYHAGSSGKGGRFQAADLSDFRLDARDRVNDAISFLGPNLSGVALDAVCFLKGLETVEQERSWPPRSAKLMLKTALAKLATYYGLTGHEQTREGEVLKWNVEGYRPDIHKS